MMNFFNRLLGGLVGFFVTGPLAWLVNIPYFLIYSPYRRIKENYQEAGALYAISYSLFNVLRAIVETTFLGMLGQWLPSIFTATYTGLSEGLKAALHYPTVAYQELEEEFFPKNDVNPDVRAENREREPNQRNPQENGENEALIPNREEEIVVDLSITEQIKRLPEPEEGTQELLRPEEIERFNLLLKENNPENQGAKKKLEKYLDYVNFPSALSLCKPSQLSRPITIETNNGVIHTLEQGNDEHPNQHPVGLLNYPRVATLLLAGEGTTVYKGFAKWVVEFIQYVRKKLSLAPKPHNPNPGPAISIAQASPLVEGNNSYSPRLFIAYRGQQLPQSPSSLAHNEEEKQEESKLRKH